MKFTLENCNQADRLAEIEALLTTSSFLDLVKTWVRGTQRLVVLGNIF